MLSFMENFRIVGDPTESCGASGKCYSLSQIVRHIQSVFVHLNVEYICTYIIKLLYMLDFKLPPCSECCMLSSM
jgi:hypothetical protein